MLTSQPFPIISWWADASALPDLSLDTSAPFRKMTNRNRYPISGSNKPLLLTVPIQDGREQRLPMSNIRIFNREQWQIRHWRTLVSVYRRSPYFEHYEPSLSTLFRQPYEFLTHFNEATIIWVADALNWKASIAGIGRDGTIDVANPTAPPPIFFPSYYQLFADRIGFLPDLSILDLLFSEGPRAASWILKHKNAILDYHNRMVSS